MLNPSSAASDSSSTAYYKKDDEHRYQELSLLIELLHPSHGPLSCNVSSPSSNDGHDEFEGPAVHMSGSSSATSMDEDDFACCRTEDVAAARRMWVPAQHHQAYATGRSDEIHPWSFAVRVHDSP
jgi:hypothetical protein